MAGVSQTSPNGNSSDSEPPLHWLIFNKPEAILARCSEPSVLFVCGGLAGALGKTATAPLDRLKLMLQVRGKMAQGCIAEAARKGSIVQTFVGIGKAEGLRGYWKGNLPQVLRVLPYSAAQLCGYDMFKKAFTPADGELTTGNRLAAGACAGMLSTLVTYPLDTLRLRLAVDPAVRSIPAAVTAIIREGGLRAMYRGIGPAMLGIAPYMAIEFATYDSLPQEMPAFARGFTAALLATTCCYPMDTLRRQIQVQTGRAVSARAVVADAWAREGLKGFYRGFVPNCLKNLPNKGIRFSVFACAKDLLSTADSSYKAATQEYNRQKEEARKRVVLARRCCEQRLPSARPEHALVACSTVLRSKPGSI